ncbi:TSUP family transporter [Stieleria magnilauensis]
MLVGLSLGMLGSGGAIVMLPVLVYVAGVSAQNAVSMSLAIVGGTSVLGAFAQFRKGHFHLKATIIFSATGVAGAFLLAACVGMLVGNWASSRVTESSLKRGFAWFVILTAVVIGTVNIYGLFKPSVHPRAASAAQMIPAGNAIA